TAGRWSGRSQRLTVSEVAGLRVPVSEVDGLDGKARIGGEPEVRGGRSGRDELGAESRDHGAVVGAQLRARYPQPDTGGLAALRRHGAQARVRRDAATDQQVADAVVLADLQ